MSSTEMSGVDGQHRDDRVDERHRDVQRQVEMRQEDRRRFKKKTFFNKLRLRVVFDVGSR